MEITIIPDTQIEKQKRPLTLLINGERKEWVHKNPITISSGSSITIQLKLDRLSGSRIIKIEKSAHIYLSINPLFRILNIVTAIYFLSIALCSALFPAIINDFTISTILILLLLTLNSFTFWRKNWILLKINEL